MKKLNVVRSVILLKKFILIVISVLILAGVCACQDDPALSSGEVDKTALISLLEDFETIPQTLDQSTVVTAYSLVRDNTSSTQKDVNEAVAGLKELKETIYATPMSFIDGGVEPHVRKTLGYDEETMITIGDCLGLETLDCTYDENLGPKIRVAYDFRYFPNLKTLDLTGNNLEDLNGFAYLSGLETLSLAENPVKISTLSEDDSKDVRSLEILGKLPIKTLDLSGKSVLSSISSLPIMAQLESLNVSGNILESFDAIGTKFPNLKTLIATDCQISTLSDVSFCSSLTTLDLSRTAVSDLTFLASLTQLTSLTLDGVAISDYTPLTQVPQLVSLSLSGCGVTDLSWISGFRALERLNLSGNQISDPTIPTGKTAIKQLDLSGNAIGAFLLTDAWSAVEELDLSENGLTEFSVTGSGEFSLKVLDLSSNSVSSFSVGTVKKLESLNLSSNALSTLSLSSDSLLSLSLSDNPLSGLVLNLPSLASLELACKTEYSLPVSLNLPSLKLLNLSEEFVCPVDLLASLTGLETLSVHLSGVSAESVAAISSLKNLTVYGGDDTSIAIVAKLPALESLTVSGSALTSPQISGNQTLKSLSFHSCPSLADLSGVKNLPALESFSVVGGTLPIPVIADFPVLRSVVLSGCGLTTVSSLTGLPVLESLDLSGNGLQTVEVLGFSHLQYLNLSHNKLATLDAVALDLTKGTLDLSGNEAALYQDLSVFPETLKIIITE